MKNIYIFGADGQDGSILKTILKKKGKNLNLFLFSKKSLKIIENNIISYAYNFKNKLDYLLLIQKLISEKKPSHIFYFAAVHLSSTETEDSINNDDMLFTNYSLVAFIFNQCQICSIKPKIIYASSSLIFSGTDSYPQNELSKRVPKCNYSKQKVLSENLLIKLGQKYDIPVVVPIFYNHESIKRKNKFFTKKIISFCSRIANKLNSDLEESITLFNPNSIIDMGYAPEYIEMLLELIKLDKFGSFIFSSGSTIKVKEFTDNVLKFYGLSTKLISYKTMKPRFEIDLIGDNQMLIEAVKKRPSIVGNKLAFQLCNDYEAKFEKTK